MKTLINLLLASMCALSATACAARPLVDLSIVDRDTGSTLPTYGHHGRSYVPGEPGHRYSLHLYNHSSERVLVVLSVDGVNAVTGQTASSDQGGYVLGPWQSSDITGWRKSYSDVAQFVFTALDDSYAARTGRPDNVGVIGMAVFSERPPQPVYAPPQPIYQTEEDDKDAAAGSMDRRESVAGRGVPAPAAAPAPQSAGSGYAAKAYRDSNAAVAADSMQKQEIGTGHGEREYAPTSETAFERMSSSPQQVTQIWYDTPQQLAERGIMPRWYAYHAPHEQAPQAFPAGFVPDPSW